MHKVLTNVWELHCVLYEEDRNVIADKIPIALLGVEFDGKPSNIPDGIGTASATEDGREAYKDGCGSGGIGQDTSLGDIFGTLEELEGSECTHATGMDNSFWDTFMIKAMDLGIYQS